MERALMLIVLNAGSSSIKLRLFGAGAEEIMATQVTRIGGAAQIEAGDRRAIDAPDHDAALGHLLAAVETAGHPLTGLAAAAHRVVHGGADLTGPCRITPDVETRIEACSALAPLHNPHNLAGIRALAQRLPGLPQFASFDTAFHASNPAVATTYALPAAARAAGIRRYGFHGISYAGLVAQMGAALPARLLAFHLGNGASLCAIKNGQSVASSMGYSPLDGLTMGTRAGSLDPAAVLRLAEDHGIAGAAALLNADCGLRGLAGESDMRALMDRADAGDAAAAFAIDHFCYWAARHAGSAIVAMGGVDAVAFTGGIGENAGPIRDAIMAHLALFGALPVHVIPAREERQIALDALAVIG